MELRRNYRFPQGWKPIYNDRHQDRVSELNPKGLRNARKDEGALLNSPPISHFTIEHTGTKPEQNFSEDLIRTGEKHGFAKIADGYLTLKAEPEDLVYKILRGPGYYCCHCGIELEDAGAFTDEKQTITIGMVHVATEHKGADSPDPSNPSGYRKVNGYECILDADQHKLHNFGVYLKKKMEGFSPQADERKKAAKKEKT